MTKSTLSIAQQKFWSKVNKHGPISSLGTRCWEWTAGTSHGYGWLGTPDGNKRAHAYVFTLIGHPVPKGKMACHRCGNRLCVRPAHLYHGTHKTNKIDSVAAGTYIHGETHPKAKLTEEQVLLIRNRYATSDVTTRDLAEEFSVSSRTISSIVQGVAWMHVGGPRYKNGNPI